MLAYVYGVVPLSLCRNGGCGSGSGDTQDASDVAYGTDDSEYLSLLNKGNFIFIILKVIIIVCNF